MFKGRLSGRKNNLVFANEKMVTLTLPTWSLPNIIRPISRKTKSNTMFGVCKPD